ncbi:gp53-like domain-containing protein [Klebsiella pneumoniae]|uniref:gp53-like domain-containing protein n=1 Tax=Klebsiella pneumoniae TaxID=573 RepID=UPI0025A21AFD|nr:phage tail protein [Klebsiella pneumoniae]MDM7104269.1 phage tail protein [Klebsiella pneumoniae]MDM7106231.1 phage tail protein [Klebsiella pneumoniae]MDM7195066.1 phage tail protein [Klebsiella pneumoniae]
MAIKHGLNVRLGDAAKRQVGTAANQLPDMSFFANAFSGVSGYCKLPNGIIIQCSGVNGIPAGGVLEVIYPITFPNAMMFVIAAPAAAANGTTPISIAIDAASVTDAKKSILLRNLSTVNNGGTRLLAIGR